MNAIERAARAVYKTGPGYDLTGGKPWEELSTSSQNNAMRNARAAFASIDRVDLANLIMKHGYEISYGGCTCDADFEQSASTLEQERILYGLHLAQAVINHLLGETQ